MASLNGLCIIVAGGGGGIGSITSQVLAKRGATVVIGDIDVDGATRVANKITEAGGKGASYHLDLRTEDSIKSVIETAARQFGRIDGIVNMAACTQPGTIDMDVAVDEMRHTVWREILEVNLIGFGLMTKHAIPYLLRNETGGSIVNISSGAAHAGEPTRPAYGASKSAVHALTRHTARKWGPQGIRANAIMVGLVGTTQVRELYAEQPYLREAIMSCPLQRMAEPDEIATVIAFLLSRDSSYVTGQVWAVDGGYLFRE
ncbi:3-oxoacyl-[acyl-carrier-protein] reductase FabG [Colletotrichum siamense]|uniref:3-oxoacyl-[acyl-carrier-protein] reductase FabG n=1 Tax=Colletotrichum siamense TaxID=690259 RepID=UPI0018721C4F|nr:3-oxoacyl-[acyl-carrier-protein] reductase FabG [Colletotrichum siamense]KAF5497352.1 3-oxoacyl-[acyl-carrier-protein] reductase FabG [Colletotrichum siamense]